MEKHKHLNKEVSDLIASLNHPFNKEIDLLRNSILSANSSILENIKWNGPNYSVNDEDRITMRVQPPTKQAQLIFHRGAKKQVQPKEKIISNKSKLLVWKENDRAIITFKSLQEIEKANSELTEIINEWLSAT